ncbi:MAG: aminotransferase class I/II-fold pyridoxal phosphate-dependent enzyme [Candidatus Limiplasma sp.]|nr:aminotransferase class I/II-fold pyridoxal phosphate-dependent enzyme [Candidatus Limiplasma sp.]
MINHNGYGHGGDVYRNAVELDFSINVNPYGTPDEVRRAIADAAASIAAYPDPYCGALREKLSAAIGVDAKDILCGNGAADHIYQLVFALKPAKTILPVPSFSEYESALAAADSTPDFYPLHRENSFALTEEILHAIKEDTSLLMLCSPNNPTGLCIPWALLLRILDRCRETGTWLFLDECFLELADDGKARSLIPELRENDKVLVLRAFTKLYGMAGVRLGYAVCKNRDMIEKMCRTVQPWNVSSVAQAAGVAALECSDWAARARNTILMEKQYLLRELRALSIAVLPGDANFLMLSGVPGLYERLLEKKILIRNCGNYRGLDSGDCRVAVRTHGENAALVSMMREIYHA